MADHDPYLSYPRNEFNDDIYWTNRLTTRTNHCIIHIS